MSLKIGILGAGRVVVGRYIEVFNKELQRAEVTCVCDLVKEKADQVAEELSAIPMYNIDDFLKREDIDIVLITTESGHHYNHSLQALKSGKHVIVEKPAAFFVDQVKECQQFAQDHNLMYAVILQNRLNPAMRILKETTEQGRFGKIVLVTIRLRWCRYQEYYEDGWHGSWALDGGVINQQATHHLDAIGWIGGGIDEVSAMQSNALNKLEAEDTTVATLKFENGALGVIEATTAARPEDFEASISVVGEKGYAAIGGIALNKIDTWKFVDETPEDANIPSKYSQEVPTGYGLSHGPLVQQIVDRIQEGNMTPPITGDDALACIRLVHALYNSAEENKKVSLKSNPISSRLGKISTTEAQNVLT